MLVDFYDQPIVKFGQFLEKCEIDLILLSPAKIN